MSDFISDLNIILKADKVVKARMFNYEKTLSNYKK